MAVMKIKTIKSNLQAVINYGKNGDKTDNGILVSSVNCSVQTAYEEMALTKKFFHKENKTLGYHIIQSFKGNEVTPEKANQIGQELARELWGDKYQVIICTHINKENVHNHLILNSVSFMDGKKYHNSNEEIALMKDTSDRLCLKYGLSIVETEKAKQEKIFIDKRIDNFNRSNEKMQKIRNDIDEAIKSVKKYSDFKFVLNAKGYEIYDKGKYFTVKCPYFSRNVRLDRAFGADYSLDSIKERIYYKNKEILPIANFKKKYYRKVYKGIKINNYLLKTSSFYRLYVHYLYKFGKLPAKNEYKELTPAYFKQKKENTRIFEELNFLVRNNFKTIQEIRNYQISCESKLPELKSQRENLWRKYNKTTNETPKVEIKTQINLLSEKITTINNYANICNRCITRLDKFREEYIEQEQAKEKAQELIKEDKKKKARNR